ncbi:VacJ family lipoprotein [uncultured Sphingomonas sp.]|uniref:MlaA family lipoprotein n=1 Tax=uncultured Sphingomonas sp. TaxID=158754 RepID=UPI0035CA0BF9
MTPTLLNALLLMIAPAPDNAEVATRLTSQASSATEARPALSVSPPAEPAMAAPTVDETKSNVVPDVDAVAVRGPGELTALSALVPQHGILNPAAQDGNGTPDQPEDIVVSGRRQPSDDPVEVLNVQSYKAVQALDGAIVAPLAKGYKKAVPRPVRRGIHNFLDNLQEPIVFLNYLLQLKPGKAAETLGRFAVNTTVGIAGVVDVAKQKPFNLPHRANSLANTLGYYGVGPGPYLFLPLIGPTTLRDLLGTVGDRLVLPTVVGAPFDQAAFTIPANVLSALDYRIAFDESLTKLRNAPNPYAATRASYLARRKAEIDGLHSPRWRAAHFDKEYYRPGPNVVTPCWTADPIAAADPASAPAEQLHGRSIIDATLPNMDRAKADESGNGVDAPDCTDVR